MAARAWNAAIGRISTTVLILAFLIDNGFPLVGNLVKCVTEQALAYSNLTAGSGLAVRGESWCESTTRPMLVVFAMSLTAARTMLWCLHNTDM